MNNVNCIDIECNGVIVSCYYIDGIPYLIVTQTIGTRTALLVPANKSSSVQVLDSM